MRASCYGPWPRARRAKGRHESWAAGTDSGKRAILSGHGVGDQPALASEALVELNSACSRYEPEGETIWMPFTGARMAPSVALTLSEVNVNEAPVRLVNTT